MRLKPVSEKEPGLSFRASKIVRVWFSITENVLDCVVPAPRSADLFKDFLCPVMM